MRALSKSKFVSVTSCDAKGVARYLDGTNEPFRGLRRPTGRKRSKERKDDQGRNDRVVQIGPDGLAASAHVMGCPQDRAAHWGYRGLYLSNAVGGPDRGRETARILGNSMTAHERVASLISLRRHPRDSARFSSASATSREG